MNAKQFAVMAVVLVGMAGIVGFAGAADADPEVYTVEYCVGAMTYTDTTETPSYTLKSLSTIGASVPVGKEFAGWLASGSTTVYAAGSTVALDAPITTFEAQVVAIEYTVTFMAADGKTVLGTDSGEYGEAVAVPGAPAIEGMIFNGWSDGVKAYAPADIPAFSADVTYTATYIIDYDVAFVVDGITVLETTVSQFDGVATPAKAGYVFVAWYDGIVAVAPDELAEYIADVVDDDVTFVAGWDADKLQVIFKAGDETVITETVLYGDCAVEPKIPAGYIGWDWDFKTPIIEDITIDAIKAPAPAPSGLKDPTVQLGIIVGAAAALIVGIFVAILHKRGKLTRKGKKKNQDEEA